MLKKCLIALHTEHTKGVLGDDRLGLQRFTSSKLINSHDTEHILISLHQLVDSDVRLLVHV